MTVTRDKLRGWEQIADYLGTSVRTAQRWAVELGLPVLRPQGDRRVVEASTEELERWVRLGKGSSAPDALTHWVSKQSGTAALRPQRVHLRPVLVAGTLIVLAGGLWGVFGRGDVLQRGHRNATRDASPLVMLAVRIDGSGPRVVGANATRPARLGLPGGEWLAVSARPVGTRVELNIRSGGTQQQTSAVNSFLATLERGQPAVVTLPGGSRVSIAWTAVGS